MPDMEEVKSSTPQREGSRASSAESSNASHKEISPKDAALLETEVEALSKTLATVSNEAARIVTRQHWRKCLIGTEKDQSFLVRAILKHSTPHVYVRAMEDYGSKMLEAASAELLDRALELRLPNIDADKLVALLAKAKRLGYDEHDVIDEEEHVVPARNGPVDALQPNIEKTSKQETHDVVMVDRSDLLLEEQKRNAIAAAAAAAAIAAPYRPPITQSSYSQNMNLPTRRKAKDPASRKFVCPDCTASFAQQGGLTYHVERKVCHRPAPQFRWFCKACNKGFTTSGGKQYHEQNKVCAGHDIAKATPHAQQSQQGPVSIQPMPPPHLADGLPPPGYAARPSQSYAPSFAAPSYQQTPPYHRQYNSHDEFPRPVPSMSAQPPPSWLPRRVEQKAQSVTPFYVDLPSSTGSPFPSTPAKSSPNPERGSGDGSVLDQTTQNEMSAKLAAEVARFEKKCREIPETLSAADREELLNKEKRGHATRKSQIRKKFGIQIRTSKLQPANFVRVPGQGDSPVLAPISRIASFMAPSANITPTYSISTPSSIEQGRQRPIMELPGTKRRRLEDSPSFQQDSQPKNRPEHQSEIHAVTQRRSSVQSPEVLEVDELSKPYESTPASPQAGSAKGPKKVQWETLPREPTPSSSPSTALRDVPNRVSPRPKPPKSGKSDTELVVLTSDEGGSDEDDEDSDIDPNEEIPARVPPGAARRKTRASGSAGTGTVSSPSASPAPSYSNTATTAAMTTAAKRNAGGGGKLFASASSSSSKRSPEAGSSPVAERRGSMARETVRAAVQV